MALSKSDGTAMRAALERLVGNVRSVEFLAAGTTGQSFLVEAGGARLVAKLFAADAPVLLGPGEQFDLLLGLKVHDIAPQPVSFDVAAGLLVTEFVDGVSPQQADLRTKSGIEAVATALQSLHAAAVELPPFLPAQAANRYVEVIGGESQLPPAELERYRELTELATAEWPGDAVPCHNDLAAENILVAAGVRLVDFDYAGAAPAIFDLACFAAMNALEADAVDCLLESYFGAEAPFSAGDFARVQRLIRLLAHFWSLAAVAPQSVDNTGRATGLEQYRIDDD